MLAHRTCLLWGTILVLCSAQAASAAPVVYNESTDGDLPYSGNPLPILAFDIGVNTVSGTFGDDFGSGDLDSFAFTIPTGAVLFAGQVALSDAGVEGNMSDADWGLQAGSPDSHQGLLVEVVYATSPGVDTLDTVPLGAGIYNMSQFSYSATEFPATANYTFAFELVPIVPEPSSAMLLLIGSMAMLRSRRM